jgi:hypothetical protein
MADASDIAAVRSNTNEPEDDRYDDFLIGALVDASGVAGASAIIWRRKAALYADLVTTSEAGASRNLSDLNKQALAMAANWDGVKTAEELVVSGGKPRARTHRIERA